MNREWNDSVETDDLGRDSELAEALSHFDPASDDPNYWLRFRSWVLQGAGRELARRRMTAQMTVGDVVQSWARALVPTALLAAALAGIVLWRFGSLPPMTVEELLVSEIQGETIPVLASPARSFEAVTFASEAF
ncbi:MAG: hypothetical protein AB7T31_00545 [Gemmatimonadales bacterium]